MPIKEGVLYGKDPSDRIHLREYLTQGTAWIMMQGPHAGLCVVKSISGNYVMLENLSSGKCVSSDMLDLRLRSVTPRMQTIANVFIRAKEGEEVSVEERLTALKNYMGESKWAVEMLLESYREFLVMLITLLGLETKDFEEEDFKE